MSHKITKPSQDKPKSQEGKLLDKLDDDILKVNKLRGNLKNSPTSPKHSIDDEIKLEEQGSESAADENWQIASEYYKNIDTKAFRQYELACDRVKQFYEEQHEKQTVAYNIQARINFKTKTRAKMSVWEGLERLNKLLDDSDPDTELSQIDHALQTAEAIRRDGKPRWFQLVGLIHDLGKLLYFLIQKVNGMLLVILSQLVVNF